jgi:hypothetical protein
MSKNMFGFSHMNKPYLLFFLLLSHTLIVSGCANVSPQQKQIWRETGPVCFTKPDCDAKWAAARNWVEENAGYKIETYSDNRIETYQPPDSSPKIAASVSKTPDGTSSEGNQINVIKIEVWCTKTSGCIPTVDESVLKFNQYVSSIQATDETCYKQMIDDIKPKLGFHSGCFDTDKCLVKSICYGSPTYRAGVRPNDILYKINDTLITRDSDIDSALSNIQFGETLRIQIIRDNAHQTYHVKLLSREEALSLKGISAIKE